MPPQAFLPSGAFTGFDANGGYSVANDASKLFGQALAEYEARLKAQREWDSATHAPVAVGGGFVNAGTAENPAPVQVFPTSNAVPDRPNDTPESLRKELIDPLLERFGMGNFGRFGLQPPGKPHNVAPGTSVVSIDPNTGQVNELYKAPPKAITPPRPARETPVRVNTDFDEFGKPKQWITDTPSNIKAKIDSGFFPPSQVGTNSTLQYYNSLVPPGASANFNTAVKTGAGIAKDAMQSGPQFAFPGGGSALQINPAGGTQTGTSGKKRLKFNPATGLIE